MLRSSLRLALLLTGFALSALPARADDLADEADLEFQLGAEAYKKGEFRSALQQFLRSNRLVQNRNVLYNIARSYEQLRQFPEAYRYYTTALELETEPAVRVGIQDALTRIQKFVALVEIASEPPGAVLFVERRELGPRGNAPRALGLAPGAYSILAELPGHYLAQASIPFTRAGEKTSVTLKLQPILGEVVVGASFSGVRVRVDAHEASVACVAPCELDLPAGPHTLYFERAGFRDGQANVEVLARRRVTLDPVQDPLMGTLLVSTDEPGALLEVDGIKRGFTPAVLPLPVGRHGLRLSLSGFRAVELPLRIADGRDERIDLPLVPAEEVNAASRVTELVEEAPSSVTIIPDRELRAFRYSTVAEALRGVSGVYQWNDRSYLALGFRGLGRLGSYGNRVLVLVDGHPMNDDWLGSSYVGYDARTNLDDLERIEVVRGPGSVLYGTNAFSGVVNLVTRKSAESGGEVGASSSDAGVGRLRVRANAALGDKSGLWTSASVARGAGRNFYFPEFSGGDASPDAGHARRADSFYAGTLEGRYFRDWFTASLYLESHRKRLPSGEYETLLGDPRAEQTDTRASIELRAEPHFGKLGLLTRLHGNHYRFEGGYPRLAAEGGLERDEFRGSWIGLEQRFEFTANETLKLTVGGEGQLHLQVDQEGGDENGTFLHESRTYQVGAAYALLDVRPSRRVRLSAGARLDSYSTFGESLNPRIAAIFKPYDAGNLKLMVGRAFRAPSVYELYYNDDGLTQVPSPEVGPESIYSAELEHTHRFSPTLSASAAAFANQVRGLLLIEGDPNERDPLHFVNSNAPIVTVGAELGLRRDWRQGYMLAVSYSYQHSRFLEGDSVSDLLRFEASRGFRHVANSPPHLGSIKGALPILGRALRLASRLSVESGRYDRNERTTDPEQTRTAAFAVWDLVLSGEERKIGFSWAAGVYNAFDWRYDLPVSREFRQRAIPQDGRSLLLSVDLAF